MGKLGSESLNDLDWSELRDARRAPSERRRQADFDHLRYEPPGAEQPILPFESLDQLTNFVPFGRLK